MSRKTTLVAALACGVLVACASTQSRTEIVKPTTLHDDHAFGRHLEPETRVFTFAVVTLGVLREPVDLSRVDDKTYR